MVVLLTSDETFAILLENIQSRPASPVPGPENPDLDYAVLHVYLVLGRFFSATGSRSLNFPFLINIT